MRVVRVHSQEDYQQAIGIRHEVFIREQGVSVDLERDQQSWDTFISFLVFNEQSTAIATGRLRLHVDSIKFERIATLKKYRGIGAGKDLMLHMVQFCKTQFPKHKLMMNAQESAVSFYLNLGWIIEGDKFYEANIPHYKLIYENH